MITFEPLAATVGAEVVDADLDALLFDPDVPGVLLDALDRYGVLVLPALGLRDEEQVALCRRLGPVQQFPNRSIPEISVISLDPAKTATAEYLKGSFDWHIDGSTDEVPNMATVLSAHALSDEGGETEFASTYSAYDLLTEDEQARYGSLHVLHSFEAHQRRVFPDPTAEMEAFWRSKPTRVHPLVWQHRNGRRSLVLGATASHVVEWEDSARGAALLEELLERATAPDLVYRHEWTIGDTVIWDNRGVLHHVVPYDPTSAREMHRTTILGDEPIQ